MKNKPLVSIIIPAYNRQDAITRALLSLERQTYKQIEVVIVDDGSSDNTVSKVNEFISKSPLAILLVVQGNKGPGSARNNGFKHSRGEIIMYLDSDDEYAPTLVEENIQAIQNYDVDLVHFGLDYGNNNYVPVKLNLLNEILLNNMKGFGVGFSRTRNLIDKIGPWNEEVRVGEDKEFALRSILYSKKSMILSKPLYHVNREQNNHLSNSGITTEKLHGALVFINSLNYHSQLLEKVEKAVLLKYIKGFYNLIIFSRQLKFAERSEMIKQALKFETKFQIKSNSLNKIIALFPINLSGIWIFGKKVKRSIKT